MVNIFICATFRDFKGTDNDKIQYKFLESIKGQSYQNYSLVTTTFGEKNVKGVVDGMFGDKSIVKNVVLDKYRFSLTDVLLNGIEEVKKCQEDSILIWCTCDIVFEPDFFKMLAERYRPGIAGIVHPNIIYKTLEDLDKGIGELGGKDKGIDLLFFDGKALIGQAEEDVRKFRFNEWGVFEYFCAAITKVYMSKRVNLFYLSKLKKIANDRVLTNESRKYFEDCNKMNFPVLKSFCMERGLNYSRWKDMFYVHCQFKTLNAPISDKLNSISFFLNKRLIPGIRIRLGRIFNSK